MSRRFFATRTITGPPNLPHELIERLNRGDCVLFVGDAIDDATTQSACLAAALIDACHGHDECPVPACRSSDLCAQSSACAVPLELAAQIYESRNSRQKLADFAIQHVHNTSQPIPLYDTLATLNVRVIITTLYDNRLEEALQRAGRNTFSVVRDADIPFDDPERVQVIRLHGTISQPDSLILTEDDAADLFNRLSPVTKIILQAYFATKTLLFVGCKLNEPYFRSLYRQATVSIERFRRPAFALQWPLGTTFAERWRGQITFIDDEPLSFLTRLAKATTRRVAPIATPAPLPQEPYKFLDFFTREDSAIFFGRDLETSLSVSTILAHRLTVFYGASGTGKTSLLLARVEPELEAAEYRVVYARMIGDPSSEVKAAVRGVLTDQLNVADRNSPLECSYAMPSRCMLPSGTCAGINLRSSSYGRARPRADRSPKSSANASCQPRES